QAMKWEIEFEGKKYPLLDAQDLERRLKQLHEDLKASPAIVHLNAPGGSILNIAVGAEQSFLNYIAPGGWPAQHSVGDELLKGLLQYHVAGDITEVDARCTIPFSSALRAAVEFFVTSAAPSSIRW